MAKYYVLCDDDCRYEGMTKEQVFSAIAEATGNTPTGCDDAFLTKLKELNGNAPIQIWVGTTTEFNALGIEAESFRVRVANGKLYFTPDDSGKLILSSENYGKSLPTDDYTPGRVFFKEVT